MTKKLDTFILGDKFGLSEEEIFEQAQLSAYRQAEMMGWTEVSVQRTSDAPFKEGEFTCYTFNLFGIDVSSQSEDENKDTPSRRKSGSGGIAARELDR